MVTLSLFSLLDTPHDPNSQTLEDPRVQSLAPFFPTRSFGVPSSSLTLNTIDMLTTHKHLLPALTASEPPNFSIQLPMKFVYLKMHYTSQVYHVR